MNQAHFEAALKAHSQIAQKVFHVVPKEGPQNGIEIYQALRRQGDSNHSFRVIMGCLNTLVKAGLINEPTRGYFVCIRVTKKVTQEKTTAEIDDVSEIARKLLSLPVGKPLPKPVTDLIEKAKETAAETSPYRIVEKTETSERNRRYEYYMNLRFERIEEMLKLLAENVDDETGLAILEIAEDLSHSHLLQLEYNYTLDVPTTHRLELNPGWYAHDDTDGTFFSQNEVPTEEEIQAHRVSMKKFMESGKEFRESSFGKVMHKKEMQERDALFREFDPDDEVDHPCYDSLLNKVKRHMPDAEAAIESDDDSRMSVEEMKSSRTSRRGMCDVNVEGISQAPEYKVWTNLIAPSLLARRAAKGISVDPRWLKSFRAFLKDVGYRPEFGARLSRINIMDDWRADNVQWRKEGVTLPARQRAPQGWPQLKKQDEAYRELRRFNQRAERLISKIAKQ